MLLLVLGGAMPVLAQEVDAGTPAAPAEPWGSERVLGGHIFQYGTLTDSAFLSSTLNFQVLTTYNSTRNVPVTGVDTTSVQQIAPILNMQLTVHVADPVSVFFNLTGGFASGISTPSLVLKGEAISYALRGGAIVRLLRDESSATQVAVLGGFRYAGGTAINLRGLIDLLQGNGQINIGDIITGAYGGILLTPFNSYDASLAGAVAHAFARWLGLQAALGLDFDVITSNPFDVTTLERMGTTQFNTTPVAAVALGFDGNSFHVPIALQLEYRLAIAFSNAQATSSAPSQKTTAFGNAFDLGLFYAGRTDLQAGVVFAAFIGVPPIGVLGPGNPGDTHNGFGALLTMRYVW
jgi:hypothetical protein